MEAPLDGNASLASALIGPAGLTVTRLSPLSAPTFPLTHPYFEIVYAPALGPTATLLGRYLGRVLASCGEEHLQMCPVEVARALGLRSASGDVLGARSPLRKAIDRLQHDRIVRWLAPDRLGVHLEVPPITAKVRDRLPESARLAHDRFLSVIDLRE